MDVETTLYTSWEAPINLNDSRGLGSILLGSNDVKCLYTCNLRHSTLVKSNPIPFIHVTFGKKFNRHFEHHLFTSSLRKAVFNINLIFGLITQRNSLFPLYFLLLFSAIPPQIQWMDIPNTDQSQQKHIHLEHKGRKSVDRKI